MKRITSIDQLKEWERNPREIDTTALQGLEQSIDDFGDLSGIVFNVRLNALVCGHQRVKALREKYGDQIVIKNNAICVRGVGIFPIRFVDWDERKHAAANIAANNQFIAGTFTSELAALINELEEKSPELITGLNFERLKVEFEEFWKNQETREDVVPPLPRKPKTKYGDLYILGKHRLLCGDSTKENDVQRLLAKEKARLIFTDPPYNVDYESATGKTYASMKFGGAGTKIFNDKKSDKDCLEFYTKTLQNLHSVTTSDATLYWWFAMRNVMINRQALQNTGWHHSQTIMWLKNSFVFARGQEYHRTYEPCMVGWKEGKKHFSTKMFNSLADIFSLDFVDFQEQFDCWYERRDVTNNYLHPTQKPVRLAERALKKNSRIGDIVVDVFGGSGSTLIACHQLNRRGFLLELDPKFCDVVVTRYVNFTNQRDILLNGKKIIWNTEEN